MPARLSVLVPVLLIAGCAGTPSGMYTTLVAPGSHLAGSPDPLACDTFSLGQHPHVVIKGFENVKEVDLELLRDSLLAVRQTFPVKSGQVQDVHLAPPSPYASAGARQETWVVTASAGLCIDLGVLPPGAYDLALKTNNVLAASAHFKVTLPADLEQERVAIQSERSRLQEAQSKMKQLRKDIDEEQHLWTAQTPHW